MHLKDLAARVRATLRERRHTTSKEPAVETPDQTTEQTEQQTETEQQGTAPQDAPGIAPGETIADPGNGGDDDDGDS